MSVRIFGKVLVIQLSRDNIRIAAVKAGTKSRILSRVEMETPAGAVEDGLIRDGAALASAVSEALTAPAFKGIKRVVFSLCTTQLFSEQVTVPALRGPRLERMLNANMDIFIPVDISDYRVTTRELGRRKDENGKSCMDVQLWAIPEEQLAGYYELATACGLSVAAINYCGSGLDRAAGKGSGLFIMAEPEMLVVSCVESGRLLMERSFLMSGDANRTLGEVRLVLEHCLGAAKDMETVICGGLAGDAKFCGQLSKALDMPVHPAEDGEEAKWRVCLDAVGSVVDVGNSTAGGRGNHSGENTLHYGLLLVGGIAAALAVALYISSASMWDVKLDELQDREQAVLAQYEKTASAAQTYAEYEAAYDALNADRAMLLANVDNYSSSVTEVFREIEELMPENAIVETMELRTDGIKMEISFAGKKDAAYLIQAMRGMKLADVERVASTDYTDSLRLEFTLKYREAFLEKVSESNPLAEIEMPAKLEVAE